jgi:hypothetical protein
VEKPLHLVVDCCVINTLSRLRFGRTICCWFCRLWNRVLLPSFGQFVSAINFHHHDIGVVWNQFVFKSGLHDVKKKTSLKQMDWLCSDHSKNTM